MNDFLDTILGDSGFLAVAYGRDPYWDGSRYKHREWQELRYRWPSERETLKRDVAKADAAGPVDVYFCPALRVSDGRNGKGGPKGSNAQPPVCLWADCDTDPDPAKIAALDPIVVASGSDGHKHLYVPLDAPIPVARHRQLNQALARYLGADSKWSDDALLRLPGTRNHKAVAPGAPHPATEPYSVRVLGGGNA